MTPEEIELLIDLLRQDPVAACLLYEDELVEALELLLEYELIEESSDLERPDWEYND